MGAAVHLRTLSSLSRSDLEKIWLLTSGWQASNLRQRALPSRRVGIMTELEPEAEFVLQIAAKAASVELVTVPPRLAADPTRAVATLTPLLDGLLVADGHSDELFDQTLLPVIAVGGPHLDVVTVLGLLHRAVASGRMRGLSVGWRGPATPVLGTWLDAARAMSLDVVHSGADPLPPAPGYRHVTSPVRVDIDGRAGVDLKLQAAVLASLLELVLHRS